MESLEQRLGALAQVSALLVACDYDGTLAPLVNDPARAWPDRAALEALRALARAPATHAAVLSGRPRSDLARFIPEAGPLHLIGSHGVERDGALALDDGQAALRARILAAVDEVAGRCAGAHLERKPTGAALHYRTAEPAAAAAAVRELLAGPATWAGVHAQPGKMVLELCVVAPDKGASLEELRREFGAGAVLFVGDDVTDESVFARLGPLDVGVKVGEGETRALHRVADVAAVGRLLGLLARTRV